MSVSQELRLVIAILTRKPFPFLAAKLHLFQNLYLRSDSVMNLFSRMWKEAIAAALDGVVRFPKRLPETSRGLGFQ